MTSSTYFVYDSKAAANASKPAMVAHGSNPSGAARKAATRGMKTILVRKAGTDKVREYAGTIKKLSTPLSVKIGNRVVKFRTQAKAVPIMGAAHSRTGVKLKRNDVEKMQGDATAVQTVDTAASRSERPPWAQRPVFVSGQTDDRFQSISDRLNKMAPELRPSVIYNVFFKDTNDDLISGFLVAIK